MQEAEWVRGGNEQSVLKTFHVVEVRGACHSCTAAIVLENSAGRQINGRGRECKLTLIYNKNAFYCMWF